MAIGDPSREDAAADALSVLRVDNHGVARDAALVGVAAEGERDSSDLQARVVVMIALGSQRCVRSAALYGACAFIRGLSRTVGCGEGG